MKSTNIIITIIILTLIAGTVYVLSDKKVDDSMMMKDEKKQVMEVMEKESMMKASSSDSSTMSDDKMMTVKGGVYELYSPEKLVNAKTGDVVLFFKANWCPSCRTVDADIKSNLNQIPKNLTLLELDYDKSSDLKKKYGVTYQHTFVQVDSDGNMIKKWSGGSTLNSIVKEII